MVYVEATIGVVLLGLLFPVLSFWAFYVWDLSISKIKSLFTIFGSFKTTDSIKKRLRPITDNTKKTGWALIFLIFGPFFGMDRFGFILNVLCRQTQKQLNGPLMTVIYVHGVRSNAKGLAH